MAAPHDRGTSMADTHANTGTMTTSMSAQSVANDDDFQAALKSAMDDVLKR